MQTSENLAISNESNWIISNEGILKRFWGHDITINKEIPIDEKLILNFPSSIKLICEAGTGYKNIANQIAWANGLAVCNFPEYCTEAVAQLVINFTRNFSSSLVQ